MVTRYTASYNDYYENDDGEFVSYQDYEALEVKYLNLCEVVEKAQRALNMALPDDEDC